jgi:hypothetical protein
LGELNERERERERIVCVWVPEIKRCREWMDKTWSG